MKASSLYNKKLYRLYGDDPREIPLYGFSQAASYLKIPLATLRSWVKGRSYPVGQSGEMRRFEPIIKLPKSNVPMLSFVNLVESHVLNGMRRIENIPFYKVRSALDVIEKQMPSSHPLVERKFETDGIDLFIDYFGQTINQQGQVVIREVMAMYLRRIDRDIDLSLLRLYPFLRKDETHDEPKRVMIDPLISFGRPVLVGTGVPTDVIAERFYAGESPDELAQDYAITRDQVEEAVRYEAPTRKAA